jgi:membrane protease YdiL (CAAX protease family)
MHEEKPEQEKDENTGTPVQASRKFLWSRLSPNRKWVVFFIIVIGGWLIRMVDFTYGVMFSIWYMAFVNRLYPKPDRDVFLGFQKPRKHWWVLVIIAVLAMIVAFLPFYLISSLCPMHLFDPILTRVYGLAGNNLSLTILFMYLAIGTFTVYAEELFFRGFLQDALDGFASLERGAEKMALTKQRGLTLLVASLVFGISHLNLLWTSMPSWATTPPDFSFIIIGVLSLSGVGYLFGILRIKSNSIWPAIIAHAIGNLFMVAVPAIILFG